MTRTDQPKTKFDNALFEEWFELVSDPEHVSSEQRNFQAAWQGAIENAQRKAYLATFVRVVGSALAVAQRLPTPPNTSRPQIPSRHPNRHRIDAQAPLLFAVDSFSATIPAADFSDMRWSVSERTNGL